MRLPRRSKEERGEEPMAGQKKRYIDTVELEARLAAQLRKREKDALWQRRHESLQQKRRR